MFDNDEKWVEDMAGLIFSVLLILALGGLATLGFWLWGWL